MIMRTWGSWLLLSIAFPIFSAAQTPPIPRAGESIEVSIVNVDTVVTDKQGRRVHGLRKEDFDIYENGVRQPITNFAEYASAREPTSGVVTITGEAAGTPHAAPQPPPLQRRTIIVFVERFQLPSFRSDPLFAAMKKLLHDTVRPGDRVMVVSWYRGILGLRQDFTDDPGKIDKAIDDAAQRTTTVIHDEIADLEQEVDSITSFEREGIAEAVEANRGQFRVPEMVGESGLTFSVEQMTRFAAKNALLDEQRKVTTLNALLRSTGGAEGRKILLLATHRLSQYAGAEAQFAAGAQSLSTDFRVEFDARPLIRSLTETANTNGFTIYPIFAEGLGIHGDTSEFKAQQPKGKNYDYLVLNNELPMLEYVARETGGTTAWGSNDVIKLLPDIGNDMESYYSLAYRATEGKAAARRIEVKVKDAKLTVRARKQFLPKAETTRMEDRVIATLFGNAPPSAFDINVTLATPKLGEKKHYLIPVTIDVPISALTTLPAAGNMHNGAFSVYMAWGATVGGVSDTHRDTKQFSIAQADLAKAKQSHFTYELSVDSLTPYLRVAFGVYDEVSKEYALKLVDLKPPTKGQ
jgi:VWFA-related protein